MPTKGCKNDSVKGVGCHGVGPPGVLGLQHGELVWHVAEGSDSNTCYEISLVDLDSGVMKLRLTEPQGQETEARYKLSSSGLRGRRFTVSVRAAHHECYSASSTALAVEQCGLAADPWLLGMRPSAIAIHKDGIYVAGAAGRVRRIPPLPQKAVVRSFSDILEGVTAMAADGNYIYVAVQEQGRVLRARHDGRTSMRIWLSDLPGPNCLLVQDGFLYAGCQDGVYQAALNGNGAARKVMRGSSIIAVASDGEYLFSAGNTSFGAEIRRTPLGQLPGKGGRAAVLTSLYSKQVHSCGGLALHRGQLYIADTETGTILRAAPDGREIPTEFAANLERPDRLIASGEYLYFREQTTQRILRISFNASWRLAIQKN